MKKILQKYVVVSLLIIIISTSVFSQNVAITDDDAYTANSSAMLDVKSLTKGFLTPRLTTTQRNAIASPATGLLVFDTSLNGFYYYNGSTWINLSSGSSGLLWSYNSPSLYVTSTTDNVGIGTTIPLHKLHVADNVSITDGFEGAFIDIQNVNNNTNVLTGFRFQNGAVNTRFKAGIFYKDVLSFGRGDLIFANNSVAASGNVSTADARLTIKNTGGVEVKATSAAAANASLFHVLNAAGDTIFAVYDGGVRVNVYDDPLAKATSSKGGFAVGGFSPSKGTFTNEYLRITPDSIRMYIEEGVPNKATASKGGFAVGGFSPAKAIPSDYFNIYGSASTTILNPSEPRIFWYPLKEALLSGRVLVESPDSVGTNSFASGFESRAIGNYSQAMGYACTARGTYATSIGYDNLASGNSSFALGYRCTSSEQTSTALGAFCSASNTNSMAMGFLTKSTGVASVALGMAAEANGSNSLSMGLFSKTYGDNSIALGSNTNASGPDAVALGNDATSSGNSAICLGNGLASGNFSLNSGFGTTAQSYASFVTGRYNVVSGTIGSWVNTEPLFIIGNGASSAARNNAVTVLKNGDFGIGTASPSNRLEVINSAASTTSTSYCGYFSSTAGSTSGTSYGIRSYSKAYGTSSSYAIYASATGGSTSGNEWAFYGFGDGYFSGNLGIGSTGMGSHKLYATSSTGGVAGATVSVTNSASNGLAMIIENSSSASSDNVVLISQKGSSGDLMSMDSYHGTGSWDREFRFTNLGSGLCDGSWTGGGADYAEYFIKADTTQNYESGDVMLMSAEGRTVITNDEAYSNKVVGVYSTNPVVIGNGSSEGAPANSVLVGMMGVVPTKVCTENGQINVGDFLTTSSVPGVAMKASKPCLIIGRAMENYNESTIGKINVLVNPSWAGNEEQIKNQDQRLRKLESENENLKAEIELIKSVINPSAKR